MEFIAAPIRIGGNGWLNRSASRTEGLLQVLGIIAGTSQGSWRGSDQFGSRERFLELQTRWEARLAVVNQMNQALDDLGIGWVRVDQIEIQPATEAGSFSYALTLSYADRESDQLRVELGSLDQLSR
ncbi:MAG TPA: hypothetical protein VJ302_20190 [Blastocatellia bacterium]|nr:hypothetical protein [Blastocatellia bacterium]